MVSVFSMWCKSSFFSASVFACLLILIDLHRPVCSGRDYVSEQEPRHAYEQDHNVDCRPGEIRHLKCPSRRGYPSSLQSNSCFKQRSTSDENPDVYQGPKLPSHHSRDSWVPRTTDLPMHSRQSMVVWALEYNMGFLIMRKLTSKSVHVML